MPKFILTVLACLLVFPLTAQQLLQVSHLHRSKTLLYRPGDWIRLEARAGEEHYHGYIDEVNDSMLVLSFQEKVEPGEDGWRPMRAYVPLEDISLVYDPQASRWHRFKHAYAGAAMAGGGMIIGGNVVNTLVNEVRPQVGQLISSTAILLSGSLVRSIGRDKYPIGRKWRVQAVPAGGQGTETAFNP